MQCPRCYQRHLRPPMDYSMPMTTCRRIFERLREEDYRADECVFTGGEPTCWPHLVDALELCRNYQPKSKIRVVTNGVGRTIADYGCADVIQVSDYGAINRIDQYHLKKQGRSRVRIQAAVHWYWNMTEKSDLPGNCGCTGLSFVGNKVWSCAMAAAAQTPDCTSIEDDFIGACGSPHEAQYQELCRSCLVNRKNRKAPKPVVQLSLWEGRSWLFQLRCGGLRR